jgi:hypothetical protein
VFERRCGEIAVLGFQGERDYARKDLLFQIVPSHRDIGQIRLIFSDKKGEGYVAFLPGPVRRPASVRVDATSATVFFGNLFFLDGSPAILFEEDRPLIRILSLIQVHTLMTQNFL